MAVIGVAHAYGVGGGVHPVNPDVGEAVAGIGEFGGLNGGARGINHTDCGDEGTGAVVVKRKAVTVTVLSLDDLAVAVEGLSQPAAAFFVHPFAANLGKGVVGAGPVRADPLAGAAVVGEYGAMSIAVDAGDLTRARAGRQVQQPPVEAQLPVVAVVIIQQPPAVVGPGGHDIQAQCGKVVVLALNDQVAIGGVDPSTIIAVPQPGVALCPKPVEMRQ